MVPLRYLNTCLILFQCLRVKEELNLANKFTQKAISGLVLFVRYINAPMALRYGTSGLRTLHHSRNDEIDLYSHLTIIQPSGYSMDFLYPYKISLRSFSYKLTDGLEFYLLNARTAG